MILSSKKMFQIASNHLGEHCDTCDNQAIIMYSSIMYLGDRIYFCSEDCAKLSGLGGLPSCRK